MPKAVPVSSTILGHGGNVILDIFLYDKVDLIITYKLAKHGRIRISISREDGVGQ